MLSSPDCLVCRRCERLHVVIPTLRDQSGRSVLLLRFNRSGRDARKINGRSGSTWPVLQLPDSRLTKSEWSGAGSNDFSTCAVHLKIFVETAIFILHSKCRTNVSMTVHCARIRVVVNNNPNKPSLITIPPNPYLPAKNLSTRISLCLIWKSPR